MSTITPTTFYFCASAANRHPHAQGSEEAVDKRIATLEKELALLRREIGQREESAYRDGLGDRAKVIDENRVLVQAIAALIDRKHPLRIGGVTP